MADIVKSRAGRIPTYVLAFYPTDNTTCIVRKEKVVDHEPLQIFLKDLSAGVKANIWIETKFLVSSKKEELFRGLIIALSGKITIFTYCLRGKYLVKSFLKDLYLFNFVFEFKMPFVRHFFAFAGGKKMPNG